MINEELRLVSDLTGASQNDIKLSDDGFLSRGYVIDGGRIVFKFKKQPGLGYKDEIRTLNFVNTLDLGVNLQKVGWVSHKDEYLGVYGVMGKSLESIRLTNENCKNYGEQIGLFLKRLHSAEYGEAEKVSIDEEIKAWQSRFEKSKDVLSRYFNDEEIKRMSDFIHSYVPARLDSLGEKLFFSHGDLGMGNIFVDGSGKIGIIDFSEAVYLDEAADFMDIEDNGLRREVLDAYGADSCLREKVEIRRAVRPMFVIGTYRERPEETILRFVNKIREWLGQDDASEFWPNGVS